MEKSIFHLMILSCESSYSIIHKNVFAVFLETGNVPFLLFFFISRLFWLDCEIYWENMISAVCWCWLPTPITRKHIAHISEKDKFPLSLSNFFQEYKKPLNIKPIFLIPYIQEKKISSPFNGNIFNWTWDSFSSQHIDDPPS